AIETVELMAVADDLDALAFDLPLELADLRGDLGLHLPKRSDQPVLDDTSLRERPLNLLRVALGAAAGLPFRSELHLAIEKGTKLHPRERVVLIARVADANLETTELDLLSELRGLLMEKLEVTLVRVELRIEALDGGGIARDALLRVLSEHAAETI